MHLFHNWIVIHKQELKNKKGGFKHLKCKTCGKQKIKEFLSVVATEEDATELGFAISLYSTFSKGKNEE